MALQNVAKMPNESKWKQSLLPFLIFSHYHFPEGEVQERGSCFLPGSGTGTSPICWHLWSQRPTGRRSSSASRGLCSPWFTLPHDNRDELCGSSVYKHQAFINSKSNQYLHFILSPDKFRPKKFCVYVLMNAKQNWTWCPKLVILSGDRNSASWSLIKITKWVCLKNKNKECKTVI